MKEREHTRVCLAEHKGLQRQCIVKTVIGKSGKSDAVWHEALLMKRLQHPCIPKVYDMEEHENGYSIVEEYIQGISLSSYVQSFHPEIKEIAEYMEQLCDVMDYLHSPSVGLLHLDLKPDNILVSDQCIYLIDFGSAISLDTFNGEGALSGTPGFAAPEMYRGRASKESDVYSAGKIMQFMLKHTKGWQHKENRRLKSKMERIAGRASAEEPKKRYATAEQMKRAIQRAFRGASEWEGMKIIALAGMGRRCGVTTFALQFAAHIQEKGGKVVYLECNESGAAECLQKAGKSSEKEKTSNILRGFEVEELPLLGGREDGGWKCLEQEEAFFREKGVAVLLEDFGALTKDNVISFLKADVPLVFVGTKLWETENAKRVVAMTENSGNVLMMLNLSNKKDSINFQRAHPNCTCYQVPCFDDGNRECKEISDKLFEEVSERLFQKNWHK